MVWVYDGGRVGYEGCRPDGARQERDHTAPPRTTVYSSTQTYHRTPPPRARRPRTPTTVASSDNVNREQRAKVWKCERKVRARLHRAWHGPDGVVWARYAAGGAGMCTVCMRGETCCESMRGVRLYAAGRAHVT